MELKFNEHEKPILLHRARKACTEMLELKRTVCAIVMTESGDIYHRFSSQLFEEGTRLIVIKNYKKGLQFNAPNASFTVNSEDYKEAIRVIQDTARTINPDIQFFQI